MSFPVLLIYWLTAYFDCCWPGALDPSTNDCRFQKVEPLPVSRNWLNCRQGKPAGSRSAHSFKHCLFIQARCSNWWGIFQSFFLSTSLSSLLALFTVSSCCWQKHCPHCCSASTKQRSCRRVRVFGFLFWRLFHFWRRKSIGKLFLFSLLLFCWLLMQLTLTFDREEYSIANRATKSSAKHWPGGCSKRKVFCVSARWSITASVKMSLHRATPSWRKWWVAGCLQYAILKSGAGVKSSYLCLGLRHRSGEIGGWQVGSVHRWRHSVGVCEDRSFRADHFAQPRWRRFPNRVCHSRRVRSISV